MATGTGVQLVCGIKKATTWGTSVAAIGAGNAFRPLSWQVEDSPENIRDMSFNGDILERQSDYVGRKIVAGQYKVDMKYQGLENHLALFMGAAGTPSGSGPYVHTITRKIDMTGAGIFTAAWYEGIAAWEVDSAKFNKKKLECTAGRVLTGEFGFWGRKLEKNTATNPIANLGNLTEPSAIDRIQAINTATITYTMAPQASSLAAFDLSYWSIEATRNYKIGDESYLFADGGYVKEIPAGEMTWGGTLHIPYTSTTHVDAMQLGSPFKLKLLHQLTSSKILTIYIPHLKITKCSPFVPGDKGEIPQVVTFETHKALSNPSGIAGTMPWYEITNSNSADALA